MDSLHLQTAEHLQPGKTALYLFILTNEYMNFKH
jgi:hypothetical protein